MLGAERADVVLGQVRVHLDLVDGGDDVAVAVQPPQVLRLEVGDADGPGAALSVELLERLPGRDEVTAVARRQRPVDEEQVDVVEAERLERGVERLAGGVGLVGVVAQLAGDEDVAPVEARLGDGLAHLGLVAVHLGGVDVPIAGFERGAHGGRRVLRLDLEDAEAELRDGLAVVQRDVRNGTHGRSLLTGCVFGPGPTCPIRAALHAGHGEVAHVVPPDPVSGSRARSDTGPRWPSLSGLTTERIAWTTPSATSSPNTAITRSSAS